MSEKKLPLYQVIDWDDYFENNRSRTYDKCAYVVSPNKHGGSGWSNVMGEPDGLAIWGIWKMLLDICSRQRRPRNGYLTADGKKEGRRLGAQELSNLLRCRDAQILRALQVLSSPEVAFIRLLDGQPEHTARAADGHSNGTAQLAECPTPDGQSTDAEVTADCPSGVSSGDTLSKVSRVTNPLSSPKGGQEISDTSESERLHTSDTTPSLARHSPDTGEALQYAEAERWLNSLFPGCTRRLDAEEMHLLSDVLPLLPETCRLLEWAYGLERDREGWATYNGERLSKPKESRKSLLRDFGAEIDKWQGKRRQLGLNGASKPKLEEPADWRAIYLAEYPDAQLPASFWSLPKTKRDELDALRAKHGEAVAA